MKGADLWASPLFRTYSPENLVLRLRLIHYFVVVTAMQFTPRYDFVMPRRWIFLNVAKRYRNVTSVFICIHFCVVRSAPRLRSNLDDRSAETLLL